MTIYSGQGGRMATAKTRSKGLLKGKFVVDERGKPSAVLLDLPTYRRLLRRLEDPEDALELDAARKAAKSFRRYDEVRADLKKAGRL
ncbi:MAG: hypothetical protein HY000_05460 [Planctomycetes bacterium]|nr:hypothetical protein [Planctomycetota bacterium]